MDDIGKDVLFGKRVFGGFSRRDVIRYIDTLQKQNLRTVQGGEDALRQARAQVQALTAQLREAQTRIDSLEAQLQEAAAEEPAAEEPDVPEEEPAPAPEPPAPPVQSAPAPQPAAQSVQRPGTSAFVGTGANGAKKTSPFSRKGRGQNRFF